MVRAQARTSKLNFWGEETLELLKKRIGGYYLCITEVLKP